MKHPTQSPSRLLKASAAVARWSLWLLLAAWLAFTVAWGALHGWIVPRIGEFRPMLEAEVSKVLGVPVRIGEITAQSMGLIPSFELNNVVLLDRQGREALRLGRVLAAVSPASALKLGFEQLYIDGPELDIRRGVDGKIRVAGLEFSATAKEGEAADWLFSQTELVIRNGTVHWTDEQRAAPPLALRQVDFVMRNGGRRHDLRLDATPPAGWGARFSLAAMFRQPLLSVHNGRWQDWDGQLYANFPQVDVSQLRRHADLGVDLAQGHGALRLWADVSRGVVVAGTADAALADVSATLGAGLQPLALNSMAGRVGGRRLAGGFEFFTRGLQFVTAQGQEWPGGNVMVSYTLGEGRLPARGELRADKLDLAALSQIANRLPLGAATHEALAAYAPKGLVEVVQANWQGRPEALDKFQVKGRVAQLEVAARTVPGGEVQGDKPAAGSPGVRGMSIDFDLNQSGGKAALSIEKGALEFPGVFEEPVVPIDQLSTQAQWQIDGERLKVQLSSLKFANADAEGQGQASWHTSDPAQSRGRARYPGVLDLSGTLNRADGTRVHRYLPLVLSDRVRHYVRDAVTVGSASGVKFRVKGDLHDMPFTNPKHGDFHISANIKNATYAFVPRSIQPADALPWPALTQLSGELVFDRVSMQVKGARGKLTGASVLQVVKAEAQIADLAHTEVLVNAEARGPLSEMLATVASSPLAAMTGQALAQASASGPADLKLRLTLPVSNIEKSKVQGSVTLAGNDVQITPQSPTLGKARGAIAFTETGFTVTGAQARTLGGDIRLEGGSRPATPGNAAASEASIVLRAQGTVTAEGLRQASELGFLSRLAQNASGGASYSAVMGLRNGAPELTISSNLQGLALNLPQPLNKTAESSLPLRFENVQLPVAKGQGGPLDQLSIELGRVASVVYVRDVAGPQARVVRGAISVGLLPGESAPLPDEGVMANLNLAAVNVDAWEAVLSKAAGAPVAASATGAGTPAASSPASSYLPTMIAVRAKELTVEGHRLHNLVVGGSREGLTWRANVDASEFNGYVEYRQSSGVGAGRVYARLARLTIAPSATGDVEALLNEPPDSVPALDVVVDDFELRGRKLGRVEVEAINRGGAAVAREGGVREWRLTKLQMTLPEASFTASGNWAGLSAQSAAPGGPRPPRTSPAEQRRTVMNFKLDISDSGALLARFGMKDVVRQGKGRMEGQVSWIGSPLALDYPTLGGQFNVNVESGQFLKADPGLAKLLGVLSLQSLPRRLTLDFRDVFTEGFSFDFVRGDVRIEQGMATTNNLQMKGVNAAVLMEGRADIAKETQNIKVVVVPEINAGTASLVASVINPAIGLGSFLAQMFLRKPLIEAATQEFQIDGTWSDPKIVKVDRRSTAADDRRPDARTGIVQ
ncbi:MAG TPA: YhdP family protein [Burkholderiaceae bacterium]|nr:YhdP family protein [Burkholderiaceae bacterium]